MMGEQDIETGAQFPWTSIGSDAGAIVTLGSRRRRAAASALVRQRDARDRAST
jgi:hypothetical protein